MASPRPVPPKRRVVEGSTWLKLSEEAVEPFLRDADSGVADDDLDPCASGRPPAARRPGGRSPRWA